MAFQPPHSKRNLWLSSHHTPRNKSFGYPANKKIPAYSYGYHSPIFSSHRSCPWKSTAGPYLIKFWLLLFLFLLSIFSRVRSRPLQTHGFLQLSAVFPWQPKVLQKIWVHSFFFQISLKITKIHMLSCDNMWFHMFSHVIMSYHVLSCLVTSYHVLSCLVMSCHGFSHVIMW